MWMARPQCDTPLVYWTCEQVTNKGHFRYSSDILLATSVAFGTWFVPLPAWWPTLGLVIYFQIDNYFKCQNFQKTNLITTQNWKGSRII
jgi:hypothetical protein